MMKKNTMKSLKSMLFLFMAVLLLSVMVPNHADAAGKSKKTIAVTANNAKIAKNKFSLTATGTSQLKVKYAGKNVTKKAKYKSSNKKVATISKKGKIEAKNVGSCTITVKYKGKTKKLSLKVTKPYVEVYVGGKKTTNISLTIGTAQQECRRSAQIFLNVGYKNSGAKKVTYDTIQGEDMSLTSTDPSIATVNRWGCVEAKKAGTCTIKISYKFININCPVTVKDITPTETVSETKAEITKHTHNWVARTSTRDEWVPNIVTIDDYETVRQKVYICDCGEKVYEDYEGHINAHKEAYENFGGYHTEEYAQVKVGSHTEDHGYYKTITYTDSWECSECGEVMKAN